tara:strand:+ start:392 stop:664 length:273 start_codon:yes stop_codon:yes gene_type:complete
MSKLSIRVDINTYGGYGSLSGDQQTVKRYITQCDNSGGTIFIDDEDATLAQAQSAFSSVLDDDVSADVRVEEVDSGSDIPGSIILTLVSE